MTNSAVATSRARARAAPLFLPKARDDLLISRVDEHEEDCFVIKDPLGDGKYFQFNELQVAVLRRLDGKTPLKVVADQLNRRFDADVRPHELRALIDHFIVRNLIELQSLPAPPRTSRKASRLALRYFRNAGLLDEPKGASSATDDETFLRQAGNLLRRGGVAEAARYIGAAAEINPRNGRVAEANRLLSIAQAKASATGSKTTVNLFNPTPLLRAVHPYTKFLFSGWAVAAMVAIGALAMTLVWVRWNSYQLAVTQVVAARPVLFMLCVYVVMLLHELSHGLACYHYGGKPAHVGLMLILYVFPVAFCDTSDIYLFRSRKARMVVFAAGATNSALVWALAVIVWHGTRPNTFTNDCALLFSAMNAATFLFNAVPLLKLDGYYLLASYLGDVRLEERAFETLKERVIDPLGQMVAKNDVAFTVSMLGLLNFVAVPLVLVTYLNAYWLREILTVGSLVVAAWAVRVLRSGRRTRGALLWTAAVLLFRFGIFGFIANALTSLATRSMGFLGVAVGVVALLYIGQLFLLDPLRLHPPPSLNARMRRWSWSVAVLCWMAFDLSLLYLIPWSPTMTGDARLRYATSHQVRSGVAGLVKQVQVEEGQRVRRGQVLVQLENRDLRLALSQLRNEHDSCAAELDALAHGLPPAQRLVERRLVESAAARQRLSTGQRERAEALRGFVPDEQIDHHIDTEVRNSADLAHARAQREARRKVDPSVVAAEHARCRAIQARVEATNDRIGRLVVRAPADGVVTTPRPTERQGLWVDAGQTLLELVDPAALEADVWLDQRSPITQLALHKPVQIHPRVGTSRPLRGYVKSIAPRGAAGARLQVVVALPHTPGWMRPNIGGRASIRGSPEPLLSVVLRPLVQMAQLGQE